MTPTYTLPFADLRKKLSDFSEKYTRPKTEILYKVLVLGFKEYARRAEQEELNK